MKLIEHFVNGKIIPGSSNRNGKVFNPATGEQDSEVRLASKSDLDSTVEIAKKAFETWSLKPSLQRARIIFKFKELIERNSEELSHVEGLDENKDVKKIRIYPEKSKALNLAFDITPAKYVTGLITEKGICEASEKGLKGLFK